MPHMMTGAYLSVQEIINLSLDVQLHTIDLDKSS